MAQDQVVSLIIKVLGDSNLGAAEKDLLKLHKNLESLTKEFAKAAKAGGFDKNLPGMQQLFESFKNGKVSFRNPLALGVFVCCAPK